jgi:hypothetical protein
LTPIVTNKKIQTDPLRVTQVGLASDKLEPVIKFHCRGTLFTGILSLKKERLWKNRGMGVGGWKGRTD